MRLCTTIRAPRCRARRQSTTGLCVLYMYCAVGCSPRVLIVHGHEGVAGKAEAEAKAKAESQERLRAAGLLM